MQVLNNDEITNKIQELNSWSFEMNNLLKKLHLVTSFKPLEFLI